MSAVMVVSRCETPATVRAGTNGSRIGASDMYVCVCNAVSDRQVKQALCEGKHSIRELRNHLGYKSCCGKCTGCMRSLIDHHLETINLSMGELSCKATRELSSC